ncbi:MAG TPA: 3-methyl-2-oxobutanoate hydroxymethyltransferase [Nitrospira sp.]|jgi:3-methyl-2-oxobutanoate hydroxymethyltransferase|nr:3-methyl-2-oxobutanoate hydroxymethyltransferase [Nitrospira sp.]
MMTVPDLQRCKREKKKVTVVTAYDALFTRIVEQAGIGAILVGDSLGVVVQGRPNTLSVTMDDMLYHTRLVAGAAQKSLVIGDMPFMSYQAGTEEAVRNAGRLLQAGAAAVKLEGGAIMADRVKAMTSIGIPVMGHLGMTPQSLHALGGYKVQGKVKDQAAMLLKDAKSLEAAGAFAIVLEAIPSDVAKKITDTVSIPTIGIGAGPHCDGQVLVLYDLLGLFDDFVPKFVKPYAHLKADALQALRRYKEEVEQGKFPSDTESYH